MNRFPFSLPIRLYLVFLTMILILPAGRIFVHANSPVEQELKEIWQRVHDAGSYRFTAKVSQTSTPLPTVVNAGRSSHTSTLHLEGKTDLAAESLTLSMRTNGGSVLTPQTAIQFKVEDGKAYVRQGQGEWEESDDVTGIFAPGGDFLAYMQAAKNVERHAPEIRDTVGGTILVTRYTFDIDGRRFAQHVREEMVQQAHREGMPASVQLQLPRIYVDMQGQGELWVGADGLPLRQTYNMRFPERADDYVTTANVTVDFADFTAQPTRSLLGWLSFLTNRTVGTFTHVGTLWLLGVLSTGLILCVSLIVYRRARHVYATVAVSMILAMLLAPLLQTDRVVAYSDLQAERQTEQAAQREEQQAQSTVKAQLLQPSADPHVDPLAYAQAQTDASVTITADNSQKYFDPSCTTDPNGDIDADGLTNLEECLLGTLPTSGDTDQDLLSDLTEVEGVELTSGGVTTKWYTDPLDPDTNKDGISDGREWLLDVNGDSLPDDTDNDGSPDFWDDDNDGDGVPDDLDLSPYARSSATFGADAPFQLMLDELQSDRIIKVEFQLSPTDPAHLWYTNNVLDWQDGDVEGPIQDVDGLSFYEVDPTLNASPNANGDMRLVPMLEIEIAGMSENLPQGLLEQFGVSVRQTEDGARIAYVPLNLVSDDIGEKNVAFSGQMYYRTNVAWSNPQAVRLVWIVQALVDTCLSMTDGICDTYSYNDLSVVQRYEDDWFLTGLHVTEEHSTQMNVIYEDPDFGEASTDAPFYMSALYGLLYAFEYTFLAGSDCDSLDSADECVGDGERDVVAADIASTFDHDLNANVSETDRMGVPNVLDVEYSTYESIDLAMIDTTVTQTVQILNNAFTDAWSENQPITPTIMFAYERNYRSLNLDEAAIGNSNVAFSDSGITVALPETGDNPVPDMTMASVRWVPYAYDNALDEWQTANIEEYYDALSAQLGSSFTGISDPEEADAYQTLSQLIYLSIYSSTNSIVEQANRVVSTPYQQVKSSLTTTLIVGFTNIIRTVARQFFRYQASLPAMTQAIQSRSEEVTSSALRQQYLQQNVYKYFSISKEGFQLGFVTAVAAVALVSLIFIYALGNTSLAWRITAASSVGLLTFIFSVYKPVQTAIKATQTAASGAQAGSQAVTSTTTSASELVSASQKAALLGLVISILISAGLFLYLVFNGNVSPGTIEFQQALAYTIATIIIAVLIYFIYLIPVIGPLITGLLSVVDIILQLLGQKTVTQWLTKNVAGLLYDFNLLETYDIQAGNPHSQLVDETMGLVAGNQIVYTLPMTTVLKSKEEYDPGYNNPAATLANNSFIYQLDRFEEKVSTSIGDRRDEWIVTQTVDSKAKASIVDTAAISVTLSAGVNVQTPLWMNSAYALRAQSCWLGVCKKQNIKGSPSSSLGSFMVLDVFPATLEEFVDVNSWSKAGRGVLFRDSDGDGLLSRSFGGQDPDDSNWDTDGDNLSDAYELSARNLTRDSNGLDLDPLNVDTDGDTLNDDVEMQLGSNPGRADSDGDGLTDAEELPPSGGWLIPYAPNKTAHIWSNVLVDDGDGDGLSDLFERTQVTCPTCDPWADPDNPAVYNPLVWNANPVPLYVDDNSVDGYVRPGATVIYTTTTGNNLVSGQELAGRVSMSPLGGLSGAPLAADVAVTSGESQSLVSVLTAGSQPGSFVLESQMAVTDFDVTGWTIRREMTETIASYTGDNALAIAATAPPVGWSAPYLLISHEAGNDNVEHISAYTVRADSRIVEQAILYTSTVTSTLTAPNVTCMADGHCLAAWGVNDTDGTGSIVGARLYRNINYPTATTIWSQANTRVVAPAIGSDDGDFLVAWTGSTSGGDQVWAQVEPSNLQPIVPAQTLAGPKSGLSGVTTAWNGVNYDVIWSDNGRLQRAQLNDVGQLENGPVDIGAGGGWPTSGSDARAPLLVFDAKSQQSLLLYRNPDNEISLDGLRLSPVGVIGSLTLDSAALLSGDDTAVALCADPVNSGWVASWSQPGQAEILFQALSPDGTLRGLRTSELSADPNPVLGLACSEPRPILELNFEEPTAATDTIVFIDSSGYGNNVTCSGEFCPLTDVGGRIGSGVNFDGTNDFLSLKFAQSNGTFSSDLWIRTTKQSEEILLRQSDFERIYIDTGRVCAWVQQDDGPNTICSPANENYANGLWHHLAHVSDGSVHQLYINGELKVTSTPLGSLNFCSNTTAACQNFTLGAANSYGTVYQGDMDQLHYHDRALTGAEVADIFEAALAIYPLDEIAGLTTFNDSSDNEFTAQCSGSSCPQLGVEGMAYTAAQFDGIDDELTVDTVHKVKAIYYYNFDGASTAGVPPEWTPQTSNTNYERNGESEEFLGLVGNGTQVTLDLSNLPPHDTVDIYFDLYLIGQWEGNRTRKSDGSQAPIVGPDYWSFGYSDGVSAQPPTELLTATFATVDSFGIYQTFPDSAPPSFSGITLYGDKNCQNRETLLIQEQPDLNRDLIGPGTVGNNNASCITFPGGKDTVATLYKGKNYQNKEWLQDPKAGNLESGWNDDVESVAVWASGYAPGTGGTGDKLTIKDSGANFFQAVIPITRTFSHTDNTIQFYFQSNLLGANASFALDNVLVMLKSKQSSIPLTNSSFTLSAWAKRNTTGGNQYILTQGAPSQNQGLIFGFNNNNQFGCAFWQNGLWTTAQYTDSEWHQYACTYDAETNLRTIYRDGVQVAQNTASADYSGLGATYIGARFGDINFFNGTLDEVAVWPTALTAAQIAELYAKVKAQDETVMVGLSPEVDAAPQLDLSSFTLRETTTRLGTIRQTITRTLTIDDDAPTTSIASPAAGEYVAGEGSLTIAGSASDPTSYVSKVEVQLPDAAWQEAGGAEVWTYITDAAALSEGDVTVSARATDAVGHQGTAATQSFIVDRTPPTATYTDLGVLRPHRNTNGEWEVNLGGTASDPNAGAQPGSGVVSVDVLLQADPPLAGNGWQAATLTGTTWSLTYQLPVFGRDENAIANPSGTYSLTLQAGDAVSNSTGTDPALTAIVTLDADGPSISLNEPLSTTEIISTALTLNGQADDAHAISAVEINLTPGEQLGALSDRILHFPFDNRHETEYFEDESGAHLAATCVDERCPTPGQPGQRDLALLFENGQRLLAPGVELENTSFTVSAWIKRSGAGRADTILAQASNTSGAGLSFGYSAADTFVCSSGGTELASETTFTDTEWRHWTCTYDATTGVRTLYLDGAQVAQDTSVAVHNGTGPIYLGSMFDDTTSLSGLLDEVVIHARTLAGYEVSDLYEYGQGTWQAATIDNSANPTWSYTLPDGDDGIEGIFQINVRAIDALGNVTPLGEQRLWRGEIDTRPPNIIAGYDIDESGIVTTTTFFCIASDLNLQEEGACDASSAVGIPAFRISDITEKSYEEFNPWYGDVFTNVLSVYEIEAIRMYSGTQAVDVPLTACDTYGHCTSAVADPLLGTPADERGAEILTPTGGTAFLTLDPIEVKGDAYDVSGLGVLYVYANDRPIYGVSWIGHNLTEALWSFMWTPQAEGSYNLQTRLLSKEDPAVTAALEEQGLFDRYAAPNAQGETSRANAQEADASADEDDGVTDALIENAVTQLYMTIIIQQAKSAAATYRAYMPHLQHTIAQAPFVGVETTVYVDLTPAIIGVDNLELSAQQSLGRSIVNLTGQAVDSVKLQHVEVRFADSDWMRAKLADDGNWELPLRPNGSLDGATYDVFARAKDIAGRVTNITTTVTVDIVPPEPDAISLSYLTSANEERLLIPGIIITDATTLQVSWALVTDGGGEVIHKVGFTNSITPNEDALTTYNGPDVHSQNVSPGDRLYAHVIHIDNSGNRQRSVLGPFIIE